MATELKEKKCKPCRGDTSPLRGEDLAQYQEKIDNEWVAVNGHHLVREFEFDDYDQTMKFVNQVADLANQEEHHPDMKVSYGKVTVEIFTHKIDGLSENDFILAAKIDEL
ncbi:MAG: 4a-hydroxytetrahydrobiopterin dehydratase [Candidatus Sumerlaeia bacterium]